MANIEAIYRNVDFKLGSAIDIYGCIMSPDLEGYI